MRVINPNALSNQKLKLNSPYCRHEKEKQRSYIYQQPVREVKHGSFTPLMFSISGGMGDLAATAYKRLASLLASKHEQPYSTAAMPPIILTLQILSQMSEGSTFEHWTCHTGSTGH